MPKPTTIHHQISRNHSIPLRNVSVLEKISLLEGVEDVLPSRFHPKDHKKPKIKIKWYRPCTRTFKILIENRHFQQEMYVVLENESYREGVQQHLENLTL